MNNASKYYGKTITEAYIKDDKLYLAFDDGSGMEIYDAADYCCEHRYLTCDDNPADLIGGELVEIQQRQGGSETVPPYDDEHETEFVEVRTDKDHITLCTHNEHNGHYGGFDLVIQ